MLKELSIWITGHDLRQYRPGVGPNSFGILRILVPYQGLFFDAGMTHDLLYSYGGSEEDRRVADNVFYTTCLAKCKNRLQKFFARIYYISVKNFGYLYFNYVKYDGANI